MKIVLKLVTCLMGGLCLATGAAFPAGALQNPQSGSIGLETTISSQPPTRAAGITIPQNGATFTSTPITISGTCPGDVLVKLFSNNVFIGSVPCKNNSYSLQADLFSGTNQLVARVYDALDQAGPDSNTIVVNLNDAQFYTAANKVYLTSSFALRGAVPRTELTWPISLRGGESPYAISVDWGDGSPADLLSQETAGNFDIKHTYKTPGLYKILVKAGDKNGGTAFLQLTGQATGALQSPVKATASTSNNSPNGLWWAAAAMLPLIGIAYWAGQKHKTESLHRQAEENREA